MATEDKRRKIMKAAERLFASRRFHEITLDEVSRAARVGKGTIYRYFADKDDLFFQTATSGLDELCELIRQAVVEAEPFERQLAEACREISEFFQRRRELFRMTQTQDGHSLQSSGAVDNRWAQRRKGLVAALADLLRRGVRAGTIRSDVPAEVLANFLLGLLRARNMHLANSPEFRAGHDAVVEIFCHGAGARAGGGKARTSKQRSL